ncbi:M20/M25/M40 family metallo-hydrolase [Oleiharenicola sp. Vm1]|uniref:M20/M25/M40 family metallo-hydrolase n=1 Tax=Oleiharenicola sp. Vm1 TaxID=3398393 RepID=UPI0039F4E32D
MLRDLLRRCRPGRPHRRRRPPRLGQGCDGQRDPSRRPLPRRLAAGALPERTSGREGFIHPIACSGSAEHMTLRFILRDFELDGLAAHRATLEKIAADLRAAEPRARIAVTFTEQYRNMRYWLEHDMRPVRLAEEAARRAGVTPFAQPIRGGTDGSNLTQRGLPTPNIFTGMHEVHSQREWVTLQDMEKSAATLLHLAQLWTESA